MGQQSSIPRSVQISSEAERLLPPDPGEVCHDGCFPPHSVHDACPANPYPDLPVYTTIHRIRKDIVEALDDPYSIEQLRDPRMNVSVIRPLVDKLYEANDVSMVYCLLVNRARFQREQLSQGHQQSVCATRALLTELISTRILRRFHEDNPGAQGLLLLAQILVGGFDPFQGAPPEVMEGSVHIPWPSMPRTGAKRRLPALEIAIISESKIFLSSSACQRVVNAIYEGRVIYTPTSFIDILPDHYKQKPISLYDPRKAPLFNQYRLIVPRTRSILEICQFVILLALFFSVMIDRDPLAFSIFEGMFMIYALGWVLDQFASMLEHGWHVYTQNLWSFLDVTFSVVFGVYLTLRLNGWRTGVLEQGQQALDVLAMGAPVLVPRLAFNLMSENMLFVSLRSMMKDFAVLTLLAVWCFAGFLLSMTWLSNGTHQPITISKWMIWIWFGLDATGVQRSVEFHWLLGPILMITFAFLGNTLFLTILVSMLSTTFSTIVANATAEIQFRRAVLTLEGVKSDAIFAYQPPFNLLALLILLPLKFILSPRWFHKINVAAVRALNAPLLLLIAAIERKTLWSSGNNQDVEQLPKPIRPSLWRLSRSFSVHGDLQSVFDAEPPNSIEQAIANDDDPGQHYADGEPAGNFGQSRLERTKSKMVIRRDSVTPFAGITGRLRDLLEAGEDGDKDTTVKQRLEALEEATGRIERILGRLCEELGERSVSDSSRVYAVPT